MRNGCDRGSRSRGVRTDPPNYAEDAMLNCDGRADVVNAVKALRGGMHSSAKLATLLIAHDIV